MTPDEIHVGSVITGPLLPEPVEVLAITPLGDSIKLVGKGCKTGLVREPILTPAQLSQLRCSPLRESFDGDPAMFRLGIEGSRSHPESKRSVYNSRWKSSKISQKSPSDGHINEHFI